MPVTAEQIAAATDSIAVQKLQTQIQLDQFEAYKAELAKADAHRAAVMEHNANMEAFMARAATSAEAQVAWMRQQGTAFDASERGEVMREAFKTLLPQAVKPSTATTPDGKRADAKADAEWLRIEVEEVMATYDALRGPTP